MAGSLSTFGDRPAPGVPTDRVGLASDRAVERLAERREACRNALAGVADRLFAGAACERERTAARDCAEQCGTNRRTVASANAVHVEQHRTPRQRTDCIFNALDFEAAIAAAHLLARRVDPVRRGHDGRSRRRAHPPLEHSRGLQQLGADQHVDAARQRRQPQDRRDRAWLRRNGDLDVIGGRPRALRHARRRSRLHQETLRACGMPDPFGQHAPALAAQCGNEHGHGLAARGQGGAHCGSSVRSVHERTVARKRSHAFPRVTTSTR